MSLILRRFLPSFTRNEPKISNYLVKTLVIGNVRFHSNDEINSKTPPPPPSTDSANKNRPISPRMEEFQEKLRAKTPIGRLDQSEGKHPYQEKEPLEAFPDNINPHTGEQGGPRGPEPTRYGDWERKGRCIDF